MRTHKSDFWSIQTFCLEARQFVAVWHSSGEGVGVVRRGENPRWFISDLSHRLLFDNQRICWIHVWGYGWHMTAVMHSLRAGGATLWQGWNKMDDWNIESEFHAWDISHLAAFYRWKTGSSFQLISRLFGAILAALISRYCSWFCCSFQAFILSLPSFYLLLITRPQASLMSDCVFLMSESSLEGWQIVATCSGVEEMRRPAGQATEQ